MRRVKFTVVWLAVWIGMMAMPVLAQAAGCEVVTPALKHMTVWPLKFETAKGKVVTIPTLIADEPEEQLAGFQHVCASGIARHPILFLFHHPYGGQFHMHNVFAPLDIAYIDASGKILNIQHMEPGGQLYGPPQPVNYVVEASLGFFGAHGLAPHHGRMLPASLGMLQVMQ